MDWLVISEKNNRRREGKGRQAERQAPIPKAGISTSESSSSSSSSSSSLIQFHLSSCFCCFHRHDSTRSILFPPSSFPHFQSWNWIAFAVSRAIAPPYCIQKIEILL
ncbi:hypothetical protein M5689_019977 [Euphorbia peplus]|nr:hypothetical protein M5689_019977 [Euphorbia peplus]